MNLTDIDSKDLDRYSSHMLAVTLVEIFAVNSVARADHQRDLRAAIIKELQDRENRN